jgi:hypothetical protein
MKILYMLVLGGLIFGLGFIYGNNRAETQIIENTTIKTDYILNGTTCANYTIQTLYDTRIQYNVSTLYTTLDISEQQYHDIVNAHVGCNNIGCGDGAIKMKYHIFDILKIPRPKFSEKPQTGHYAHDDTTYIKVLNDSISQYIKLDNDYWYILQGNTPINYSTLCHGNETIHNSTVFYPKIGHEIFIRHV